MYYKSEINITVYEQKYCLILLNNTLHMMYVSVDIAKGPINLEL